MRVKSSLKVVVLQWTQVVVIICPCLLVVPSTLKAWRGGIGRDGRRRCWMREGSMKFPVSPQSMRTVVAMVLALYCSQMGNWIAHSDLFATSTEVMTEEEDVVTTSCSKKMLRLSRQLLQQAGEVVTTHRASFLFLPILLHILLVLPPPKSEWMWM